MHVRKNLIKTMGVFMALAMLAALLPASGAIAAMPIGEQLEEALNFDYADYSYVGDRSFDSATNTLTAWYTWQEYYDPDPQKVAENVMNDVARYLGALHRQGVSSITEIEYDSVTYEWNPAGTLLGSNWEVDGDGATLVSAIVADFQVDYDPLTGIELIVGDGTDNVVLTMRFFKTLTVCETGCDFDTIQDAIDAAEAGDTIEVGPGTYTENIVINKDLTLQGAGWADTIIKGVAPTGDPGMLRIDAPNVVVDGFTIRGVGNKTVRITQSTTGVEFTNNRVEPAEMPDGVTGWSALESNTATIQNNLIISGNTFVGNNTGNLIYLNPNLEGLIFTDNVITGTASPGSLVAGFEGLDGTQDISGNTFDIDVDSPKALLELFGTFDILETFEANTFPDGFIPSQNKVVEDTVVFPSTNDDNRDLGWAHVNKVVGNVHDSTITLEFISTRTFLSCFEYRTDGDTDQKIGDNNHNPNIADGLYPFYCQNNSSRVETFPVDQYIEIRMSFGGETDERFNWTRFDLLPELWVCETGDCGYPGIEFDSIQGAIDAADIGTLINVLPGTYEENIELTVDDLTLRSNPGASIKGETIHFLADNVTLEGFIIDNLGGERAIAPGRSHGATIRNNVIRNSMRGIQGDVGGRPTDLTIVGNTFDSTIQYGIAGTEDVDFLIISGNTFQTTVEGIGIGEGAGIAKEDLPALVADQIWDLNGGYALKDYRADRDVTIFVETGGSIQDAIDAAKAGDTIMVGAGTYEEGLTINKSVSILGPNAAISPNNGTREPEAILKPQGSVHAIEATASDMDVVFKGFTIDMSDSNSAGGDRFVQIINRANTSWDFEKNIFKNAFFSVNGNWYITGTIDLFSLTIYDNYFYGSALSNGIALWSGDVQTINITNNTWENNGAWAMNFNNVHGVIANNTIKNSGVTNPTFPDDQAGMILASANNDVTMTGNTFENLGGPAVMIYESFDGSLVATGNKFLEIAHTAVNVREVEGVTGDLTDVAFTECNWFIDNLQDINNRSEDELVATGNWWGSVFGPDSTNIIGDVIYEPWSGDPGCTFFLPADKEILEAVDDSYDTYVNGMLSVPAPGVLENDTLDSDAPPYTAMLLTDPDDLAGSLVWSDTDDGSFTYTPPADWVGRETFEYIACDAENLCSAPGTVTIDTRVHAVDDAYFTFVNETLVVSKAEGVLANDTGPAGETLTATLLTPVDEGAISLMANGGFIYAPPEGWTGVVTFTYEACGDNPKFCSLPATVTITIGTEEPREAPEAVDDEYQTDINQQLIVSAPGVLANDIAPDGEDLIAKLDVSIPLGMGVLDFRQDGGFSYVPPSDWTGSVSFTYTACYADDTAVCSEPATVTIEVVEPVEEIFHYYLPLIFGP